MITRKFTRDFNSQARTLRKEDIGTHADGWTIEGEIHEDYYEWVNDFKARHPTLGRVWGNFESEVKATSRAAYDDFIKHHSPQEWDYYDI